MSTFRVNRYKDGYFMNATDLIGRFQEFPKIEPFSYDGGVWIFQFVTPSAKSTFRLIPQADGTFEGLSYAGSEKRNLNRFKRKD